MKRLFQLLSVFVSLLSLNCTDSTEPVDSTRLKISLIDASVHEAYFKLEVSNPSPDELILLQRNGENVMSYHSISDTLITDTGLNENTDYSYRIIVRKGGKNVSQSNVMKVRTLLPTSHEITWREFKIGNGDTRSDFWDILVRNENDIWACGEIYLKDSKGNVSPYGCAHWDGLEWKFYKTMHRDFPAIPAYEQPVYSVIEANNTIFGLCYAGTIKFGGNRWYESSLFVESGGMPSYSDHMMEMWAKDEYSIYCGGGNGSVYLISNTGWKKIRGDKVPSFFWIMDIWGITEPVSGKTEIYCLYDNPFVAKVGKILKITDVDKFSEIPIPEADDVATIWTNKGYPIFVGGRRSFFENSTGSWKPVNIGKDVFFNCIRGSALNDIFAVGDRSILSHFNGEEWKQLIQFNNFDCMSVDVKGNTIAVAGMDYETKGVVLIGTR